MSELSGFEVLVLAKEIDLALRGTYVNNIYTIGTSQLIRLRRPGGEDSWLVVSPKKGVWLTTRASEREETSEFTTRLRGELERSRFAASGQAELDRVFILKFEGSEERSLVVELMPPGNIVVTGPGGKIRLALNEFRSETRRISRGETYAPPRQTRTGPADVGIGDVKRMLEEEKTLGKAIGRHVALPKKYVAEALGRLGAAERTDSDSMKGREHEIVDVLHGMVEAARVSPAPCVCETPTGDELYAFHPAGMKVKAEAESLSELCDRMLFEEALAPSPREDPGEARRKELEATVAELKEESERMSSRAAQARESASLARSKPLAEALEVVKGSGAKLSKDPTSSAGASSALFDLAKELERKASLALQSAGRLEKKAARVQPRKVKTTRTISKKKSEWFEKFRWFVTAEGRLAIGGRDAQSNSAIIGRHMDANDTVYHADLFGSPFFVLKGGSSQSEEEVREVAQATVTFSSAWKTGLGSADAYWVAPDQVSSGAPSGEYLARGSFAIKGKKNFVQKMMVELAVGVDRKGRVTAGPEAAVRRSCDHYVVLVPHNEKGSETAKRVLKDLTGEGETTATLDEIQRALPAGGGKVIRRV